MKHRRRKGLFGRLLEWLAFGVVLAVPALYFAWPWLPVDGWLERIELRNPIVMEEPSTTGRASAAPQPDAASRTTVYRCVNEREIVLSDEPCGDAVETLALPPRDVNVLPAEAITGMRAETGSGSEACRHIDAELEEIYASLKAGYSMQRGRELRARRAALLEQGRSIGCF